LFNQLAPGLLADKLAAYSADSGISRNPFNEIVGRCGASIGEFAAVRRQINNPMKLLVVETKV
jgi:hypothetical protein